jgi:hypothetical protein
MPYEAASHVHEENGLKCKELVINIPAYLGPAEWPEECCIYRVPKKLRKVNKEAYTPKLISIGPFHHRRQEYRDMEMQKVKYLKDFCKKTEKSQEVLASIVKEKEVEIRRCYAETSKLNRIEFLKMILLDGIFIIELFRRNFKEEEREKDYILSKPWLREGIQHDLLLLENQLPYFVLEDLYNFACHGSSSCNNNHKEAQQTKNPEEERKQAGHTTFLKLCREYFSKYDRQPNNSEIFKGKKIKHLTDLLRYFFYPSDLEETEKKAIDRLCSATKLDEAGVKFKQVTERHLLDIQFQKGIVTLPY